VLNDELKQIKQQMADLQTANNKTESDESMQTVKSSSAAQKSSHDSGKSSGETGLFEYLIEDNIQLRQSTA